MTSNFSQLKKNRQSDLEKLTEEISKLDQGSNASTDERLWYPQLDKAKTGQATIRFLPAPEGEDVPFVRVFEHGFKGPTGKWYIEKSLTTIGKDDPVSLANTKLWDTGLEENQDIARNRKRKLYYYSNIYVIRDPATPANEGKVFLFKYGKKIFDKLNDVMHPQFEGETPVNPFDLWEGANFKFKIRQVEGYTNYDKSEFDDPEPLFEDDDKLEAVWKQEYSLKDFVDPTTFKSYEDLERRFNEVVNGTTEIVRSRDPEPEEKPKVTRERSTTKKLAEKEPEEEVVSSDSNEDDEGFDYFRKLANADD